MVARGLTAVLVIFAAQAVAAFFVVADAILRGAIAIEI